MYEYIKGTLIEATPSKAIVEVQGLGYHLFIPFNNFSKFPTVGSLVTLYTSFVVREDSQKLYGFLTRHERDLFENLLGISGIGPKTALCLIGHMQIYDLQAAISEGNTQVICKIPGIGKKTAERLIVEMRDKITREMQATSAQNSHEEEGPISDAVSALIHLGYHRTQAQKAIKMALSDLQSEPELAQLITAALRCI
jgi:holliday junction DNA helicase RuvA